MFSTLITNLAEIIKRPYFKATFQFFSINLNTRMASSCCHEQHSPTHPGFKLINRKQPIQSQSCVTVDVPSLKKDPLSLWGSIFSADTNGPPTWKPSKDLCRQKCLRVFFALFLHFICIPGRVLAFHQHIFFLNSSVLPSASAVRTVGGRGGSPCSQVGLK